MNKLIWDVEDVIWEEPILEMGTEKSGYYGHSGRHGEVGGSAASGLPEELQTSSDKKFIKIAQDGEMKVIKSVGDMTNGRDYVVFVNVASGGTTVKAFYKTGKSKTSQDQNFRILAVDRMLGTDICPPQMEPSVPPKGFPLGKAPFLTEAAVGTVGERAKGNPAVKNANIDDVEKLFVLDILTMQWNRHDGNYVIGPNGEVKAIDNDNAMDTKRAESYEKRRKALGGSGGDKAERGELLSHGIRVNNALFSTIVGRELSTGMKAKLYKFTKKKVQLKKVFRSINNEDAELFATAIRHRAKDLLAYGKFDFLESQREFRLHRKGAGGRK